MIIEAGLGVANGKGAGTGVDADTVGLTGADPVGLTGTDTVGAAGAETVVSAIDACTTGGAIGVNKGDSVVFVFAIGTDVNR